MRANWHAFYQRLTSQIHRSSSEHQYDAIRVRYPALVPLPNIDQMIFHQQCAGGDPEQRNAVLMSLVVEAQAGAVHALQAEYYAQRATAGLIVSEATQISPQGKGYAGAPGIHSLA